MVDAVVAKFVVYYKQTVANTELRFEFNKLWKK
jgi:hypothetical protein